MCVGCQLLLITHLLVIPRDTALACRSLDTATQFKTWATLAVKKCGRLRRSHTKAIMLVSECVSLSIVRAHYPTQFQMPTAVKNESD